MIHTVRGLCIVNETHVILQHPCFLHDPTNVCNLISGSSATSKPKLYIWKFLVQFSSVTKLCPTVCHPMDCSTPGIPVHHQLPELAQTHVHQVGDTIQPSCSPSSPSPPALNLSQHQGLFQWVISLHQRSKALEFQLHHQSFQWILRTDFL